MTTLEEQPLDRIARKLLGMLSAPYATASITGLAHDMGQREWRVLRALTAISHNGYGIIVDVDKNTVQVTAEGWPRINADAEQFDADATVNDQTYREGRMEV